MFDFMINHLSRQSEQFQDFIQKHDASPYRDMFIRFKDFWPGGAPTQEQVDMLNKRKNHAPCERITFADGTQEDIWCTFSEEQMDLNMESPITWEFVERSLRWLMDHGASMVRLDAFAFATKKLGTSCFFVEPEMWDCMKRVADVLAERDVPMLPEIHDHYKIQLKIAEKGYPVYDFALPVLVLHTLYTGNCKRLKHWFSICPKEQYTTLDTHDGIGTVDVEDLLTEEELQNVIDQTERYGANFKMDYSAKAKDKPVVYQINCTYYSALGEDDDAYLLARLIQFFTPGIPQVYYVGMLAGTNDFDVLGKGGNGREINRHNFTVEEIEERIKMPMLQRMYEAMRIRNTCDAFNGEFTAEEGPQSGDIRMSWKNGDSIAVLEANLASKDWKITYTSEDGEKVMKR